MSSSAEKVVQPHKASTSPPKRFLFEFMESRSRKNTEPRTTPTGANREKNQKAIPEIQYFPKPQNLEEAYHGICDSLVLAYHEVRGLLINEKINDFDNTIIRQVNFQDPKGCLEFFKNIIFSFSQKLKGTTNKDESSLKPNEYEKMLQKSELKIRDLIRNEQIYRLGFDQFTTRQHEDEKVVANLEAIIQQNWTLIEQLNQENLKLSSLVKQKNEEIESISKEKENYFSAQLGSSNGDTFSARLKKYSSTIVQSMSPPNLQMPKKSLHDGSSKNPSSPERSTSITTGTSKGRSLHKSGTTTDLIPSSLKNLNLHGIDKLKEEARNRIGVYTDRKQADTPGEQSQCNSARFAELSSLIKDQTAQKSFIKNQTHKVKKSLSVGKQRVKRDDPHAQERFSPSARANNPEELAHALLKAELIEDLTGKSSFRMSKIDKTRNIGEWIKVNESHDVKSKPYKRKSIMTNIRSQNKDSIPYMEEKSGEVKSQLILRKEPSSSSILAKDIPKLLPSEHKEKNTEKINKFLRNIMFQKLTEQKSSSKKI